MTSLKDIEASVSTAMKAGDRDRTAILRLLVSTVKSIAKNDGNREVADDDIIAAGNRMIKQARETRAFLPDGDARIAPLDAEIAIVEEFLPQKMARPALEGLISDLLSQGPEGKAARGFVMKELNGTYRGQFDAREANDILSAKIA